MTAPAAIAVADLLSDGEMTATEIAAALGISRNAAQMRVRRAAALGVAPMGIRGRAPHGECVYGLHPVRCITQGCDTKLHQYNRTGFCELHQRVVLKRWLALVDEMDEERGGGL